MTNQCYVVLLAIVFVKVLAEGYYDSQRGYYIGSIYLGLWSESNETYQQAKIFAVFNDTLYFESIPGITFTKMNMMRDFYFKVVTEKGTTIQLLDYIIFDNYESNNILEPVPVMMVLPINLFVTDIQNISFYCEEVQGIMSEAFLEPKPWLMPDHATIDTFNALEKWVRAKDIFLWNSQVMVFRNFSYDASYDTYSFWAGNETNVSNATNFQINDAQKLTALRKSYHNEDYNLHLKDGTISDFNFVSLYRMTTSEAIGYFDIPQNLTLSPPFYYVQRVSKNIGIRVGEIYGNSYAKMGLLWHVYNNTMMISCNPVKSEYCNTIKYSKHHDLLIENIKNETIDMSKNMVVKRETGSFTVFFNISNMGRLRKEKWIQLSAVNSFSKMDDPVFIGYIGIPEIYQKENKAEHIHHQTFILLTAVTIGFLGIY